MNIKEFVQSSSKIKNSSEIEPENTCDDSDRDEADFLWVQWFYFFTDDISVDILSFHEVHLILRVSTLSLTLVYDKETMRFSPFKVSCVRTVFSWRMICFSEGYFFLIYTKPFGSLESSKRTVIFLFFSPSYPYKVWGTTN